MDQMSSNTLSESQSVSESRPTTTQSSQVLTASRKFNTNPQFVMFGTYKCEPKAMKFGLDGIKITDVSPNNDETRFTYNIAIPYEEISDFYYCVDRQQPSIFIKPTCDSNSRIRNHLYLGEESINGNKFDINSADVRQHFIIAVFDKPLIEGFVDSIKNMMQMIRRSITIKDITVDESKLMLIGVQSIRFERTANSVHNSSPAVSQNESITSLRCDTRHSIGCQIPEIVTIDEEDVNRCDSNDNNNSEISIDSNNNNNNAQNESEFNAETESNGIINSGDTIGVETVLSEVNSKRVESGSKFINYPQYVMFGTYKCDPKTIEFDSDGIKITRVRVNSETRSVYHISIPYVEMSEFYCCVDRQQPSIFIKPTIDSNRKIQKHLNLGEDSKNGNKFDINCANVRHHFIISVFNHHLSNRFVENLKKMIQATKESAIINDLSIDRAKLMLNRVLEFNINNPINFLKVINSRSRVIRDALKPYDVNASRVKSKNNNNSKTNNTSANETMAQTDDNINNTGVI